MTPLLLAMLLGQATPDRELLPVDGEPTKAAVASLKPDGTLQLADGKTLDGKGWYALRAPRPTPTRVPHVLTTNGDRISGTLLSCDGDRVSLKHSSTGIDQVMSIPVSALRHAWLIHEPADVPDALSEPRSRDAFLTRRGDVRSGSLTLIDAATDAVRFDVDKGSQSLNLSKLAVIAFNTDLARPRAVKGRHYRLTLADGSRLTATTLEFDGQLWWATTLYGQKMKFPDAHVVEVEVEAGPAKWLAKQKPASFDYASYLGERRTWSPLPDDLGIHLPVGSTIAYGVGSAKRFEAMIDRADDRSRGSVRVEITVDDRVMVVEGELPKFVRIDTTKVKTLRITVKAFEGGAAQSDVILKDARLIE